MSSTPLRVPRRAPRRMPPPMVKDNTTITPKHISSPSTSSASTTQIPSPYEPPLPSFTTPSATLYSASPPSKHKTPPSSIAVVDISSIVSEDGGGTPRQMFYQSAQPLEINEGALQAWQMGRIPPVPAYGLGISSGGMGVGKSTPRLPTRKTMAQKKREREGRRCRRVFYQGEKGTLSVAFDEAEGEEETGYDVLVRLVCEGLSGSSSSSSSKGKTRKCTLVISPELWTDDSGTTVLGPKHMRSVAAALSNPDTPSTNILITAPPVRAVDVLSLAAFLASSLSSDSTSEDLSEFEPAYTSPPRSPLEAIPTSTSFFPDSGTHDKLVPPSPRNISPQPDDRESSALLPPSSPTPSTPSVPSQSSPASAPSTSSPPSSSHSLRKTPLTHLLRFNASLDTALDTVSQAAEWGWRGAVSRSGMICVGRFLASVSPEDDADNLEVDLELHIDAHDDPLDVEGEEGEGVTAHDVSFEHVALWKAKGALPANGDVPVLGDGDVKGNGDGDGDKASDAGAEGGRDGSVGSSPEAKGM